MRNFKKKQIKTIKVKEQPSSKPPPLDFINTNKANLDENKVLESILSGTTNKLMQGFSSSQKQIITNEFSKMIKTLKKKLTSPDKTTETLRKTDTKTQRFEFIDPYNCSKETIRKNICTERKPINIKSPKNKIKVMEKQTNILSPKKSSRNHVSQYDIRQNRNSNITSPKKAKKTIKIDKLNSPTKKQGKLKRRKHSQENENMGAYMLIGGNFIEINGSELKQMESEILFEQSGYEKDQQLEFIWKEFMDEKQKLSRERVLSTKSNKKKKSFEQPLVNNELNKKQPTQIVQNFTNQTKQIQKQKLHEQFYNSSNFSQHNNKNIFLTFPKQNQALEIQSVSSQNSQVDVYIANPAKSSRISQQDTIKMRTDAINLQIKINRQILDKLLQSGKIDKLQYQQHMDLAIEIYDKEMTEIEKIKDLMEKNEEKVQNLIKNTKNNLKLTEKLEDMDADRILDTIFGEFKRKSQMFAQSPCKTNQQENQINGINILDEIQNYTLESSRTVNVSSPEKSQNLSQSRSLQKIDSPTKKGFDIESFQKFQQDIDEKKLNLRLLVENRMAVQLGIVPLVTNQGIKTSVAAVFQFIKNFYGFLKVYHLQEFLTYVNMPYGYSVEQRLLYMQGYDDQDQNENGIIYGVEEVISPNILEVFHENFYYKNNSNAKNPYKSYEKIHHKAIFDAINEAINQFRPYFIINGPPYPWTSSQKALTYYFIRQDCYEQLLQKVQLEVLRWSSSLCGLLIPEATNKIQNLGSEHLSIEQIFQKYTVETDCELLEQRQTKIMKQQKIEINETYYQWLFHDQFKTAVLYEVSSFILQDLAIEISIQMQRKMRRSY